MSTIIDSTSSTQPTIELNHVEEMKSIGPSQPEEVSSGSSKDNSHGDSVGGMKENKTSDENPIEQEISNGDVNTPNDVDTNSKAMLSKPYYCQICMTTYPVNDPCFNPYELSCGHIFCNDCLFQFLYSKITDGEVYPKCFMKVESILNQTGTLNQQSSMYLQSSSEPPQSMASMPDTRENSDFGTTVDVRRSNSNNFGQVLARIGSSGTSQGLRGGTLTSASHDSEVPQSISLVLHEINSHIVSKDCGQVISESDIVKLISTDTNLFDKWKRFSFFHNNPNGRECPNITCRELLLSGSAESPNMTCPKYVLLLFLLVIPNSLYLLSIYSNHVYNTYYDVVFRCLSSDARKIFVFCTRQHIRTRPAPNTHKARRRKRSLTRTSSKKHRAHAPLVASALPRVVDAIICVAYAELPSAGFVESRWTTRPFRPISSGGMRMVAPICRWIRR